MSEVDEGGREQRWLHTSQVKAAGAQLEITMYLLTRGQIEQRGSSQQHTELPRALHGSWGRQWKILLRDPSRRSLKAGCQRQSDSRSVFPPALQGPEDTVGDTELWRRRQSYRAQVSLTFSFIPSAGIAS